MDVHRAERHPRKPEVGEGREREAEKELEVPSLGGD